MIAISEINHTLSSIIEFRNQLSLLSYNDQNYDKIEEELHDLEDQFVEEYGDFIEEVVGEIYDEYSPDMDILSPIAYVARTYKRVETKGKKNVYEPIFNECVRIELDDYPNLDTRLVLLPNPLRFVLLMGKTEQKEVWRSE